MSKRVSFKKEDELDEFYIFSKNNDDIQNQQDQKEDNDTDYEEEKDDPKDILIKLLKGRSFGSDSYGDDYESSVELKRNLETTFENLHKLAFNIDNLNKFNQYPTPTIKNEANINKARSFDLENNNIDNILGSEKDKEGSPCPKCSEPMKMNYNPCNVCSRETIDIRCINCIPNILELCSPKCRSIYEGEMQVIEITNDKDETIIIVEDDGENMVLQVVNHNLFYQELNQKDSLMINKPCPSCVEDLENSENSQWEEYKEALSNNEPVENLNDPRPKVGVIPVKCYNCNDNYSYLVVCPVCYKNSGIKYICDEC